MTDEATPRPWKGGGHPKDNSGTDWREIVTVNGEFSPAYIAQAMKDDAALIVEAVNAYDALKAKNAAMREVVKVLEDVIHEAEHGGVSFSEHYPKMRTALARVRP